MTSKIGAGLAEGFKKFGGGNFCKFPSSLLFCLSAKDHFYRNLNRGFRCHGCSRICLLNHVSCWKWCRVLCWYLGLYLYPRRGSVLLKNLCVTVKWKYLSLSCYLTVKVIQFPRTKFVKNITNEKDCTKNDDRELCWCGMEQR